MKKIIFAFTAGLLALSTVGMAGCQKADEGGECRIHGTMQSSRWDGKRIFLVPMFGPQDAAHVDSVVIENGKFEFTADTTEMKVIRVDYHYREGAQDLLVVSEPGDVKVTIGSNSVSSGTPQNDSLQVWKDQLMTFNQAYRQLRMQASEAKNDSILMTKGKEVQQQLQDYNRAFTARQPKGVLREFLERMYPTKK